MEKKYTILMALMGLEIGGAETHVVELSKQLNKEGYRIIVASNGGVYVKELEAVGIKHYKVPMNKRSIRNMRKSYYLLEDIIKNEKIDIVHSHARIPSFICGILKRKMDFAFVTSAHWVFYTGLGLKYITDWGQKVVAVSDDIKEYLIENYGVKKRDIFVTINGIDTDKFSPLVKGEEIKEEFNIKDEDNCIVYVSRMDESRALVAKQLIKITPELNKEIKNLRILIVGGGDVFDKLKDMSDEVNKKIGHECITMTGGRTDINKLIACGKIFIGVSRAALEAMAAAKPTIVAGNEGYIGLFAEEKLSVSQSNNFCCRGCEMSSKELLFKDIIYAMNFLSDEEREKLGSYGREVIFKYYSVAKMASDCKKAYNAVWKETSQKQFKVVMSGYYGFNNAGDDAILISIYESIMKMPQNIKVTVLANNPKRTRKKYDVDVVNRHNIFSVVKAINNADVLLSGGGSLLQDRTSTRSILYYLSIIKLAKLLKKKVILYANGIGPVVKQNNRLLVKNIVNQADLITLREENSLEELKSMGVDKPPSYITADPVFIMEGIDEESAFKILEEQGIPLDKPIVGISVRNWKGVDIFFDKFALLCDMVASQLNRTIVFIPMQIPHDVSVSEIVQNRMKSKSYILKEDITPYETLGVIGVMDMVMSMRLHTLIFAGKKRIPLIGFSYDPKVDIYLKEFGMPNGGTVENMDVCEAFGKIMDLVENREEYVKNLDNKVNNLEKLALENEKYLVEVLGE